MPGRLGCAIPFLLLAVTLGSCAGRSGSGKNGADSSFDPEWENSGGTGVEAAPPDGGICAGCGQCAALAAAPSTAPKQSATVTGIVDGDTVQIADGSHVRYVGVNTPETYPQEEYFGPEARARNTTLVNGRQVWLEFDAGREDVYGRTLAYVWLAETGAPETTMINAVLVKEGYAETMTVEPNTRYRQFFECLEAEARSAQRGQWAPH